MPRKKKDDEEGPSRSARSTDTSRIDSEWCERRAMAFGNALHRAGMTTQFGALGYKGKERDDKAWLQDKEDGLV